MNQPAPVLRRYEDELLYITVEYKIHSSLSTNANQRYLQEIKGSVILKDERGNLVETIGTIKAHKLLLTLAVVNHWPLEAIFLTEQYIHQIGQVIYDFEREKWQSALKEHFSNILAGSDVLVLSLYVVKRKWTGC